MNEELYKRFQEIQNAEHGLAQIKGSLYGVIAELSEQTENLDAMKKAYFVDEMLSQTYEAMRCLRYSVQMQLQSKSGEVA